MRVISVFFYIVLNLKIFFDVFLNVLKMEKFIKLNNVRFMNYK